MRNFLYIALIIFLNSCAYSQQQQQSTFCATKSGAKYHRCDCRYVNSSSIELNEEAIAKRGLQACSVCRPGTIASQENLPDSSEKPQGIYTPLKSTKPSVPSTSTQCTAKTKVGTRCKRTASKGSDRCWQHQQ